MYGIYIKLMLPIFLFISVLTWYIEGNSSEIHACINVKIFKNIPSVYMI